MASQQVDDAMESAVRRVSLLLQNAEALERAESIKHQLMRRKASIDARLRSTIQSQLHDVRLGLILLHKARDDVLGIKTNLEDIERQYNECRPLKDSASITKALADERNELKSTIDLLEQIFAIPERVDALNRQLDEDCNILQVHHELSKLERCRDQVLAGVSASMEGKQRIEAEEAIKLYFKSVSDVEKRFKQKLWFESHDLLELVQRRPATLVSILRVIQREEIIDEKSAKTTYRPKRWRKEFLDRLELNIENRFDSALFLSSVVKFISAFNNFYFQDLIVARDEMPSRFPGDYDIYPFYLQAYHNRLITMVANLKENPEIQPHEIMTLLNWCRVYRKQMKEKLGIDTLSTFTQQIIDNEDEVHKQYLTQMETKLMQWCENLINQETQQWCDTSEDPKVPPLTPDQRYDNNTTVILFQMLNEQVEVAFMPGGGPSFARNLLHLCCGALTKFILAYGLAISDLQAKYFGPTPTARPQALAEWMMSVINGLTRAVGFVDEMKEQIAKHVSAKEAQEYKFIFDPVVELLYNSTTEASSILMIIVFRDLAESFDLMFTIKWLRSKKPFETILVTLKDYCDDFKAHMHPEPLNNLMESIATRTLVELVKAILAKRMPLRGDEERTAYLDRLAEEADALKKYFLDFNRGRKNGPDLLKHIDILYRLHGLLKADKTVFNFAWLKLRQDFPDVTRPDIEAIVALREDLPAKDAKHILKTLQDTDPSEGRAKIEFFKYLRDEAPKK
eukprot:m.201012 g.201012  ORF g.201012 m.201012 type:complete len:739 (+) comp53823_c0_seq3:125-2341(+)